MSIFSRHFPLGLGTARFPIAGPDDKVGLNRSIKLVLTALERGVDYIDVGPTYSAGMAPSVLKEALRNSAHPFSVTTKVMYGADRTADDARRRVEAHLSAMGLNRAQYFTCWSIGSYADFEQIMKKGGIYDGALQLKEEGIVDHICCSLHTPPEDMIRIIESGVFEGITVSYSLLNAKIMQPVLDAAQAHDIGVAVMNPLGGGLIAQNRDYFSIACGEKDAGNTIRAALRFVKAHPAVDIVLGGVSSVEELEDSLHVFSEPDPEFPTDRMNRVMNSTAELKGFCTGCKYCKGCPKGIPTAAIMQARNALLLEPVKAYNRQEPDELLYHLQIFRSLHFDHNWLPDIPENPCVQCGLCEEKCTQKLKIIDGVSDIYRRAALTKFSKMDHKDRLRSLIHDKGYKKVGLYPSGGFSGTIQRLYQEFWGKPEFEWLLFNSDAKQWGQIDHGLTIHNPADIPELSPDFILVCTYKFDQDIFESLRQYEQQYGIRIEKLHRPEEMPWVF